MDILSPIIVLVILLFSAILHEIAHGYVAERLGDPTARLAGRLTLNPKNHIDPMMSIALPLILLISGSPIIIGAAKPVPVDPFNLRDGRKDLALVSLAGPLTNVLIAIIASLILRFIPYSIFYYLLSVVVQLNLLLAIFNLLPIPPLDGSKIFALLLPEKTAAIYMSLQSMGFFIIFLLLFFPIGGFSLMGFVSS
ncbi:MAG: site-2 protease family protein, partial [Candidatus Levybacteria bacterium]|nr:site-2 protease family protein [Candidatus Levybacteria bacterium]